MIKESHIYRLIDYIESNLHTSINIENFSKLCFTSRMQLHRDFYSIVGHTVKSYISKRRLSIALAYIKSSEYSFADIAYRTGYSSQQSFCRAVRKEIGITPSQYRDGNDYYLFPRYSNKPLYAVLVTEISIPQTLCLRFYHSSLKSLETKAINKFYQTLPDYSGRVFGRNGSQHGSCFCYELYITDLNCDRNKLWAAGFEIADILPASTCLYAVVSVPNDECKIGNAWDYLYKIWLGESMFESVKGIYFEEYIRNSSGDGTRPSRLKLYIAIKKRNEQVHIRFVNNPNIHFIAVHFSGKNAEHNASRHIIDYLSKHRSGGMKAYRIFYFFRENDNSCACGVKIAEPIPKNEISDQDVYCFTTDCLNYLVFESNIMEDYDRVTKILIDFAKNNHFILDEKEIFAVYNAEKSFDVPKFQMYCGVKMLQNDKTSL